MGHTKWSDIQAAKGMHRRVVYVDNEAWETARAFASENLTSMSAVVRKGIMHITQRGADALSGQLAALEGGTWSSESVAKMLETKDEEIARLKRELAARRDTSLREMNATAIAIADDPSFGYSRPAPKTPRRKKP